MTVFHALIRTHHVTSRKKINKLSVAAQKLGVFALLRTGGGPGIMYVEGTETGVKDWVAKVHSLKYKDYQLAIRPEPRGEGGPRPIPPGSKGILSEVKDKTSFADTMDARGLLEWWRRGMGYRTDSIQSS